MRPRACKLRTTDPFRTLVAICPVVAGLLTGCVSTDVLRSYGENSQGIVFYLPGAGGGGELGEVMWVSKFGCRSYAEMDPLCVRRVCS